MVTVPGMGKPVLTRQSVVTSDNWDRDRLQQVFSTVISNALFHGDPTKPVTVTAGAEALRVWVEVHNEGLWSRVKLRD